MIALPVSRETVRSTVVVDNDTPGKDIPMSTTTVPEPPPQDWSAAPSGPCCRSLEAVSIDDVEFGSLSFVAVAASYWIFAVLPPALIVAGLAALRRALGADAGLGAAGIVVSAVGIGAMALGNGIEVASISVGGGEVALGHALLLIGFLVSIVGGILLGIVVFRRRRDWPSRGAGLLLALALPVGIGIGVLGRPSTRRTTPGSGPPSPCPPASRGCCSARRCGRWAVRSAAQFAAASRALRRAARRGAALR